MRNIVREARLRAAARRCVAAARIGGAAAVLAAGVAARSAAAAPAAPVAPADTTAEFRVFEADLGPAWIDVAAYPPEQQKSYALFSQRCCKCHTLARPINSTLQPDQWDAYVSRMSRKPGSGISPRDAEAIRDFLVFDTSRRARKAGIDPELLPFLKTSRELSGVDRFPACLRDVRPGEDGVLRVSVEGDPRLDLGRFLAADDGQKLVKWSRRAPHQGEIVRTEGKPDPAPARPEDTAATKDPALAAAVAEAVGEEKDPREKVELILDWLDEEVHKEFRAGTADAKALLSDPRGDATEFTAAFVAMCRAAGIPARPCTGLVARRTAFYASPWAEVRLANGWIAVDPYLGQLPADRTHVKVQGGAATGAWDLTRVPDPDRLQLRVSVPESEPAAAGGSS